MGGGLSIGLLVIGIAVSIGGIFMGESSRSSLVLNCLYVLPEHCTWWSVLCNAPTPYKSWLSVVIRRLAEGFMKNLILMLVLSLLSS